MATGDIKENRREVYGHYLSVSYHVKPTSVQAKHVTPKAAVESTDIGCMVQRYACGVEALANFAIKERMRASSATDQVRRLRVSRGFYNN